MYRIASTGSTPLQFVSLTEAHDYAWTTIGKGAVIEYRETADGTWEPAFVATSAKRLDFYAFA